MTRSGLIGSLLNCSPSWLPPPWPGGGRGGFGGRGPGGPQPLVCVIDDAQWLDRVSAQLLAFVARRLLAERVALVFAVREPGENQELGGLDELIVGGLNDEDARALLDSVITGPVE